MCDERLLTTDYRTRVFWSILNSSTENVIIITVLLMTPNKDSNQSNALITKDYNIPFHCRRPSARVCGSSAEPKCCYRFQCNFELYCYWSSQTDHHMDQEQWFICCAFQSKSKGDSSSTGRQNHSQQVVNNRSEEGRLWPISVHCK